MQRRLCSAILLLQAVVLGLSSAVLVQDDQLSNAQALSIGLGLALACLLVAGMLRRPWAYGLGWAIQVAALALGYFTTVMIVLGLIFGMLWYAAMRIGRLVDTDRAAAGARNGARDGATDGASDRSD